MSSYDRFETLSYDLGLLASDAYENHMEEAKKSLQRLRDLAAQTEEAGFPLNNKSFNSYRKLFQELDDVEESLVSAIGRVEDLWDCLENDQLTPGDEGFAQSNYTEKRIPK